VPSLRKRKLPSGRILWDIKYRLNGIQKYRAIGETDRRTAEKIFHKFCNQLAEQKSDDTGSSSDHVGNEGASPMKVPTLQELAEHAKIYAQSNKSPKTLQREQQSFNALTRFFGDIPLSDLTPASMELFKADQLTRVSPSTINIVVRQFTTALSQAVELGWLDPSFKQRFRQIRVTEAEPPRRSSRFYRRLILISVAFCYFYCTRASEGTKLLVLHGMISILKGDRSLCEGVSERWGREGQFQSAKFFNKCSPTGSESERGTYSRTTRLTRSL
jgi:hypothetical protein